MALKNQKKNKRHIKELHKRPGNPFFSHKLQNRANKLRKAASRKGQPDYPPFYLPDKND